MVEPKPLEKRAGHSLLLVRLIALDKFVKGAALVIIGVFILRMIRHDHNLHDTLRDFVNDLRLDENNQYIHGLLEKTLGVSASKLRLLSTGTFIYAVLYFVEGVGLWLDQAWAEWMTVIGTAAFIPIEVMEILKGPTVMRVVIFLLNVLAAIYLILRLKWRHEAKKEGVDVKTNPEGVGH